MRRRKPGRPLDGLLILDKPGGWTSNKILQKIKALYGAAKAGHTGNLDPLATGVLPICFGQATKLSQFLLNADKRYHCEITFGYSTTTGDADGETVKQSSAAKITAKRLERATQNFLGELEQVPPMYSAIKKDGVPLYQLARKGIEIEREARRISIYELRLLNFFSGSEARAEFQIHCSKGTYVRTLAEDLGKLLDCPAHLSALRRTASGTLGDTLCVDLPTLEKLRDEQAFAQLDELLLPAERMVENLPAVSVPASSAYYLRNGQPVQAPGLPVMGALRITLPDGSFIGVGEAGEDGRLSPTALFKNVQKNSATNRPRSRSAAQANRAPKTRR